MWYLTLMGDISTTADTELVLDDVISDPGITVFAYPMHAPPQATNVNDNTTSHLQGPKAAGANVLGCDGHAAWRKFGMSGAAFAGVYISSPDTYKISQWISSP